MKISNPHMRELKYAKQLLENPGFLIVLSNYIGKPIESGLEMLPEHLRRRIHEKVRELLTAALNGSIYTLGENRSMWQSKWIHKTGAGMFGAAGGFFGIKGALVELPFSTSLLLRSIASIAKEHGEDLDQVDAQLACLEVFALGSSVKDTDDASESGYYAVRIALARAISEASKHIAAKGLGEEGVPVIIKLVTKIASRFSVVVSENLAAKSVPVVGAVGGATVNLVFMTHFQNMAEGHFIIRKLEREYDKKVVKDAYTSIPTEKD
jgi:hypothetical protein